MGFIIATMLRVMQSIISIFMVDTSRHVIANFGNNQL